LKPGQRKAWCIVASSVVVLVVICIAYCQHKELVERERGGGGEREGEGDRESLLFSRFSGC